MFHKKKEKMTRWEYLESLKRMGKIVTSEEAKAFHKEMRKYKNGPKVPLSMRYPDLLIQISSSALATAIVALIYVAVIN